MKPYIYTIICLLLLAAAGPLQAQTKDNGSCRYAKTPQGYLMVLREGDNVLELLEGLTREQKIPSAYFTGIGFAQQAVFGFYDFEKKKFNPKSFYKVEMGSLTGSIAWKDGSPSLHMHGVAADKDFNAFGGHILSLTVGTGSMEIYITTYNEKLQRKTEQPLNANVLQLPCIQ
ncbi:PPC domain-containing DNA-binding protein [Flavobacterium hungaricum]|uniref:DNA-binding protein n=1 Tax=Flavobacterium hungaricum TaxID=2082725 RepID=A0ABR9TLX5_9FLAO|nr:PPC domain-containing DNA-binding protein [Flavobacterium hungaricum]MBE8726375.1 DNA-binding protein [Flavobacterium hungaricum]